MAAITNKDRMTVMCVASAADVCTVRIDQFNRRRLVKCRVTLILYRTIVAFFSVSHISNETRCVGLFGEKTGVRLQTDRQ